MKDTHSDSHAPSRTALLPIDVQAGFDDPFWGRRNQPRFEENATRLYEHARRVGWPIFHVRHLSLGANSPLRADRPGSAFASYARPLPGEPVFEKHVNSAFIGTDLEARLREAGVTRLVVFGLTTDHCVSTSTRMAGNLGFEVLLVGDATATHDRTGPDGTPYPAELVHAVSLASLHGEFARVVTLDELLGGE